MSLSFKKRRKQDTLTTEIRSAQLLSYLYFFLDVYNLFKSVIENESQFQKKEESDESRYFDH